MVGIYKITNPSGKVYIGQAVDIERRWKQHSDKSYWSKTKLYNSFKKYGVGNHTFKVIEECLKEELNSKERYYQEKYNVLKEGLNHILQDADEKVKVYSEETKQKMSKWQTGLKKSEEHKRKISEAMKGKKQSEETKSKRSEALKGHGGYWKGKERSEETKRKISEAKKGKTWSKETK